jgi:hypothetical protein
MARRSRAVVAAALKEGESLTLCNENPLIILIAVGGLGEIHSYSVENSRKGGA